MDVFPAGFPLAGATVAVAGEGEAAEAKARLFTGSPAILLRVASERAAHPASYAGARLAFIAVSDHPEAAAGAARRAGALVNVVDRPELCDFTTPAIVDRGAVVGAVLTGGAAPLLAAELRGELEALWPEGLGEAARLIQALRAEARAALPGIAARRAWQRRLLDGEAAALAIGGQPEAALAAARRALAVAERPGRISLLPPPPSPDLISLRALRRLGRADRLVLDKGVDPALLAMARRDAVHVRLQETSMEEIAAAAARGEQVVCIGRAEAFANLEIAERLPIGTLA